MRNLSIDMLNEFESWFLQRVSSLRLMGLECKLTLPVGGTLNDCVYIDLDSDSHFSRITLWNSGQCEIEIINLESEDDIKREYIELQSSERLIDVVEELVVELSNLNNIS